MTLLDRLMNLQGPDENNVPVHSFIAALAEYRRQAVTAIQVKDAFDLSATEATHLQEFLDNLDADTIDRAKLSDVLTLGAEGYYPKAKVKTELGLSSG